MMATYAPGWKQNYYPGYVKYSLKYIWVRLMTVWVRCRHGFATRADLAVPEQRHGKEDAFKETVEWFKKHLV